MYHYPKSATGLTHEKKSHHTTRPAVTIYHPAGILPIVSLLALVGCANPNGAKGEVDFDTLLYHNDNVVNYSNTSTVNCLEDDSPVTC